MITLNLLEKSKQGRLCKKCGSRNRNKYGRCNPCRMEYDKAWVKANPHKRAIVMKRCREKNLDKFRARERKYQTDNKEQRAAKSRSRNKKGWALGERERAESLRSSVTTCACCFTSNPGVHNNAWRADHDHVTGLFRGFLCNPCNVVIGYMESYGLDMSPQVIKYLGIIDAL